MSELNTSTEYSDGTVHISDSVLKTIANLATGEVGGVNRMSGGAYELLTQVFGKKTHMKGVSIEKDEDSLRMNISIVVDYGSNIPNLCVAVQKSVKDAVENMTGLKVSAINIEVVDIIMKSSDNSEGEDE